MSFSRIIGVDFATDDRKKGMVLATREHGCLRLDRTWDRRRPFREILKEWAGKAEDMEATLIAVDAPLGWPVPLSEALQSHEAGQAIKTSANCMFRRRTDAIVQCTIQKRPLEVGANLIARTAHAALVSLDKLREDLGKPVPLAWTPSARGPAAIEVYPAATLKAYGIPSTGYKKPENRAERCEIICDLRRLPCMNLPECFTSELVGNADTLDAAVCVLAADDFIAERAARPADERLARREGWIWVRPPLAR